MCRFESDSGYKKKKKITNENEKMDTNKIVNKLKMNEIKDKKNKYIKQKKEEKKTTQTCLPQ